ncbi:hypothetical protein [Microcystis phage MJing1]|nr:hypothetical protein [Microcystis phage MJing1]
MNIQFLRAPADNPSGGTSLANASSAIERLLARDSGEPDERDEQQQDVTAEGEEPEAQQSDEPEDETQSEPDEGEEGAEGEEDAAEQEDEAQEPDPAKTLVTVTIDGKTERLPLEEVTKGYLRQADYTRKTQALAEERKTFQQHASAVVSERQQYAALLPALEQQIKALMPQEPDWDRLAVDDPVEFNRQWAAKQLRDQKLAAIREEQTRLQQISQQEAQQQARAIVAEERQKLAQVNKAWADETRWKADRQAIREFGRQMGWTDEELSAVTDHRAVYALWLASQAHKAMTQKPTARPAQPQAARPPAAPTAARPGTARTTQAVSELTRAKQRLAKTNQLRDAASVIERLI